MGRAIKRVRHDAKYFFYTKLCLIFRRLNRAAAAIGSSHAKSPQICLQTSAVERRSARSCTNTP